MDPKSAAIGVAGALLLVGGLGRWHEGAAQSAPSGPVSPSHTRVYPLAPGAKGEPYRILVIDAEQSSMAVYRLDTARGELKLEAVRRYRWDLRLDHYNSAKPYPVDVQRMVQLEESR